MALEMTVATTDVITHMTDRVIEIGKEAIEGTMTIITTVTVPDTRAKILVLYSVICLRVVV